LNRSNHWRPEHSKQHLGLLAKRTRDRRVNMIGI
jgi:hypothetical protein